MLGFVMKRLSLAIPTVMIVVVVVFFLVRMFPGDPAQLLLKDQATPEALARLRHEMGLDQNVLVQFLSWLRHAASGDLGTSIVVGKPALPMALQAYGISLTIAIPSVILATLIAVPTGLIAAWKQNSLTDTALVGVATLLLSVPTFWSGLLILLLLGVTLNWFPVVGYVGLGEDPVRGALYLAMPILTLSLHEVGSLIRMARASSLEVLRLDYVTHARAKGASEGRVLAGHVLRNAFGPTWTLVGLIMGNLVGGIAIVETVFTIPGIGRLIVESIYQRDYPVVQACLLVVAVSYVLINMIVDLFYPLFDPRVARQ